MGKHSYVRFRRGLYSGAAMLANSAHNYWISRTKRPNKRKRGGSKTLTIKRRKLGQKQPSKIGFPFSPTGTKTKKRDDKSSGPHSDLMGHDIKINHGRKYKSSVGKWIYSQNYSKIITTTAGQQYVNQWFKVLSPKELIINSGAGYADDESYAALADLNPYQNTAGSQQTNVVLPKTDSFIVKSVNIKTEITNMSPVSCYMDVYIVRAKKNNSINMDTAWSTGLLDAFNVTTPSGISFPAAGSGNAAFGGFTEKVVGSKPGDSKKFRDLFKIDTVKHLNMSGGSTHNLNIDVIVNKVIKREEIQQYVNEGMLYIGNLTFGIMVVCRGQVGLDTTNAGTTGKLATYMANELATVSSVKYHCCAIKGQASRLDSLYTSVRVPSGANDANTSILSVVDTKITASGALD